MNKAKYVLSAVAAVAAIGGAFALKSKKTTNVFFRYDTDGDQICTTQAEGYVYTQQRVAVPLRPLYIQGYATITLAASKACDYKYYQFAQ